MYEEWSVYWPDSKVEPFAAFINNTLKYVVPNTLTSLAWRHSNVLSGDLRDEITALKQQSGKVIGVHGSISLVQSLPIAGLGTSSTCGTSQRTAAYRTPYLDVERQSCA